jgi:hypothetical protein
MPKPKLKKSPLPEDDLIEAEEELVRKLEYLLTLNQENIL